ncbi:MAG: DUF5301 domain-containing protein [Lachnospiraceae bacterium]|nr:DUF5301 domain-containing protein [Lachnospiraceae bacterium]
MKKFLGLLLLIFCAFSLFSCGKKADPIVLPDADKIVSVTVTSKEIMEEHVDQEWVEKAISNISDAIPTNKQSISDAPHVEDYIKIDFLFEEGASTLFAYQDGRKYYVEQPYQGIYEIDTVLYEWLTEAEMTTEERGGYKAIVWGERRYVPYCAFSQKDCGKQVGIVDGDENDRVYEWKGHAADEWIINIYVSGLMDGVMLYREEKIRQIFLKDYLQNMHGIMRVLK